MSTAYRLLRGKFHAVGAKPDADTVRFRPSSTVPLRALTDSSGSPLEVDPKLELVDVRLQGIDALETHYRVAWNPSSKRKGSGSKPRSTNCHQPSRLAKPATHAMLGCLGIEVTDSDWNNFTGVLKTVKIGNRTYDAKTDKEKDPAPGWVITREADRNGRLIGWVFGEDAIGGRSHGSEITESELARLLPKSANHQVLKGGHAYPYFFYTLSARLRGELADATRAARKAGRGLWADDKTRTGLDITDLAALKTTGVFLPYLFRKVAKTWRLGTFVDWWDGKKRPDDERFVIDPDLFLQTGDPYLFVVSGSDFRRLGDLVGISKDGKLKLKHDPEDIVFLG